MKPDTEGIYLIKNDESNPPLRWACHYHPHHGWSGIGHILERVIKYWSPWPDSK
jgi:hypothetical protein